MKAEVLAELRKKQRHRRPDWGRGSRETETEKERRKSGKRESEKENFCFQLEHPVII